MERHDYTEELRLALADERVARALHTALRDVRVRARFDELRARGLSVEAAVEELRGPHLDACGRPYFLSVERVRGIVYRKRALARERHPSPSMSKEDG
jgi:hypothetical protein